MVALPKVTFTNAAKAYNVGKASKKVMQAEDFLKETPGATESANKLRRSQENSRFLKLCGGNFKKELLDKKKAEGDKLVDMISKERADIKGLIKMGSTKKKFTIIEAVNKSQAA